MRISGARMTTTVIVWDHSEGVWGISERTGSVIPRNEAASHLLRCLVISLVCF